MFLRNIIHEKFEKKERAVCPCNGVALYSFAMPVSSSLDIWSAFWIDLAWHDESGHVHSTSNMHFYFSSYTSEQVSFIQIVYKNTVACTAVAMQQANQQTTISRQRIGKHA
jgi:hypothetical protein